MQDSLKLKGRLAVTVFSEDGSVKEQREFDNLIVNVGKNYLASAVLSAASSPFTHMAVGTGTTAAAVTDTTLQTELARSAFTTSSRTDNVVSISTTYGAGTGTGALTEAGLFSASSGGTMLSRVVFAVVNKGATDTLQINWTITLS